MRRNYKLYSACLSLLIAICGCDSFLEETPKGSINDTYAQTEKGAEAEMLSLYQVNTELLEQWFMVGELGNDLLAYGGNVRDYWKGLITYTDTYMIDNGNNEGLWKWLYVALSTVNTSINSIHTANFSSESRRNELLSEAHALRAFYLHQLVEIYGPAAYYAEEPITTPEEIEGAQPGVVTFYKRIFADLEIADKDLKAPSEVRSSSFGRMDQGIAKAIRMRALMSLAAYDEGVIGEVGMQSKQHCYEEAVKVAVELINNYGYKLEDDFARIFAPDNTENNEIIWSIQYGNTTFDTQNNFIHRYWVSQVNRSARSYSKTIEGLQAHSVFYGREYRAVMPTYYFIKVFNKYDKRRDATFISGYCRTADWNESPDFTDTLLIRSLDVLPREVRSAYEARGIVCDDVSDIYDVATGAVLDNSNVRSCANIVTKWLDSGRSTAKQEYAYKDAILIRLGEVYITLAEAYTRLGKREEAAQIITELRERTLVPGHEAEQAVNATDINIPFILDEGARELGGELFRWQMLKRALDKDAFCEWIKAKNPDTNPGNAGDGFGIKPYHINRPVPLSTINSYKALNIKFNQNDGYAQ